MAKVAQIQGKNLRRIDIAINTSTAINSAKTALGWLHPRKRLVLKDTLIFSNTFVVPVPIHFKLSSEESRPDFISPTAGHCLASQITKVCEPKKAPIAIRGMGNPWSKLSNFTHLLLNVWSAGCVFAELLLGQPIFPGESGVDQLVEIIKVLGTPTHEQIRDMNPDYREFKFPQIKAHPWPKSNLTVIGMYSKNDSRNPFTRFAQAPPTANRDINGIKLLTVNPGMTKLLSYGLKVFRPQTSSDAIQLVSKLLDYTASKRLKPLEACLHSFFDELRHEGTTLPDKTPLPPLFNFSQDEYLTDTGVQMLSYD
ncbi:hypothetical protein ACTXT7_006294 [Hymenolepis weldensis]